jgi:threonine dehydrogenase-like Zn-dependent dehydrogenase
VTTVQAATLVAPYQLEVRDYPYPESLEPGAVLLRMRASGICGTDKHTFRGEVDQYPGSEKARKGTYPLIQGHENVGIVEAVGEGAGAYASDGTLLEPGDRVVPAPNRACGRCRMCQRGFPYYLCERLESYGNALASDQAPHLFGGWSEYMYLRPGIGIFRVPDSLPDDVAVMTEIFAVTHSLERAAQVPSPSGFRPGDTVAVIGVGALGQAHAVKASLMGASRVFAIDHSQKRLDVTARVAGAEPATADELRDVDLVVDATGFPGSFGQAVTMVRDGGTIIEVGAFVDMGEESFNPAVLCGRNLTLLGIAGEDLLVYERTLALMARHADSIPFAEMVSHRFGVQDAPAAMETALDAERSAKVLITPGG